MYNYNLWEVVEWVEVIILNNDNKMHQTNPIYLGVKLSERTYILKVRLYFMMYKKDFERNT